MVILHQTVLTRIIFHQTILIRVIQHLFITIQIMGIVPRALHQPIIQILTKANKMFQLRRKACLVIIIAVQYIITVMSLLLNAA